MYDVFVAFVTLLQPHGLVGCPQLELLMIWPPRIFLLNHWSFYKIRDKNGSVRDSQKSQEECIKEITQRSCRDIWRIHLPWIEQRDGEEKYFTGNVRKYLPTTEKYFWVSWPDLRVRAASTAAEAEAELSRGWGLLHPLLTSGPKEQQHTGAGPKYQDLWHMKTAEFHYDYFSDHHHHPTVMNSGTANIRVFTVQSRTDRVLKCIYNCTRCKYK